jgi:nickel-type superoxide dismutase maturation protease
VNRTSWRSVATVGAALYGLALAVNRSVVDVEGPSMEPALWAGDRLVTIPARPGWLEPGQVVVVADPADADHLVVKRLAAIETGRVVVLGDNPRASTDSRSWRALPLRAVRRLVLARWPDLRTPLRRSVRPQGGFGRQAG